MVKKWLKDEILPIRFGCSWIRGHLNISRTGLYTFQLFATDPEVVTEIDRKNWEIFSTSEAEDESYYQSNHEE
jgi:3-phenylpropionate/cinnamic acid dioxygenase small subunit